MLLNKLFEGIKQEIKNTFRQMKWKHNTKPLNTTEAALHGKFIKAYLRKQEKKIKQFKHAPKLSKNRTNTTQTRRRKNIKRSGWIQEIKLIKTNTKDQ